MTKKNVKRILKELEPEYLTRQLADGMLLDYCKTGEIYPKARLGHPYIGLIKDREGVYHSIMMVKSQIELFIQQGRYIIHY